MFFVELCLEGLRTNKSRVLLTGLGVFVGVTAVVMILALTGSLFASLDNGGADRFTVGLSSSAEADRDVVAAMREPELLSRREALRARPDVADVIVPPHETYVLARLSDGSEAELGVGFDPDVPVSTGLGFSEVTGAVALAYAVDDQPSAMPVGSDIVIDGRRVRIVGHTPSLGDTGGTRLHLAPWLRDAVEVATRQGGASFTVVVPRVETLTQTRADVLAQLNAGLAPGLNFVDYSAEDSRAIKEMASTLGLFLGMIASISLVVAALNVVNVMYISTLERADEIAIYRALGMSRPGVIRLFLFESTLIVSLFAVAGCVVGNLVTLAVLTVMGVPMTMSWATLGIMVAAIVLVGVGGGLSPARKAAAIDPVRLMS